MKNKTINSFATQLHPLTTLVLMRDINQKTSDIDKPIATAWWQSLWLSYLLSSSAISLGGLSIFFLVSILGTKSAQASIELPPVTRLGQSVAENSENRMISHSPKQEAIAPLSEISDQESPLITETSVPTPARFERLNQDFRTPGAAMAKAVTELPSFAPHTLIQSPPSVKVVANPTPIANSLAFTANPSTFDNHPAQVPAVAKPTAIQPTVPVLATAAPTQNQIEDNSAVLVVASEDSPRVEANPSAPSDYTATVHSGRGGASLLGGTLQAQTPVDDDESPSLRESITPETDPLAPTLRFQGLYVNQEGSSARARVTGIYPLSTNALFGGTVDLTTGDDFSDSQVGSLSLNELYFTGSLPSLPNLRLTVGQVDLTSYFDRNSFAKDIGTHFFNPVFQTNPALAASGIGPRPAALLNWNITDQVEAKVAAFSSSRNLSDFAVDAFASELGFRVGNGIIRGTFTSDRDAGRDGFQEIFGIERDDGEFGPKSGDRENAFGLNAEYFIPEVNLGLFARYGHYENTELDTDANTYSLGLNLLDLFLPDDRLGFGYGRNLSNDELRRDNDDKVPDVWELFYDFRISPNLRAGATLQARDEFSDFVAGFRVRTDFDLLGRLFR